MKIYIEIPARGGSKGVLRKALKPLGGKPLIAHTISHALTVRGDTKVFVNTDDAEIRDVSLLHGAEAPFLRPQELATDSADLGQAHRFALDWYKHHQNFVPDIVIIMSPTNPFRRKDLVNISLETALGNNRIFNIASVAPVPVVMDDYFSRSGSEWIRFPIETECDHKPQSFYQSSLSFNIVMNCRTGLPMDIIPFPLSSIEAVDIDTMEDYRLAVRIIEKELYLFE